MIKIVLLSTLTVFAIAASPASEAQISRDQQAQSDDPFVPAAFDEHWLKCADDAGMCGVNAG